MGHVVDDTAVVLVEPQGPRNIGSICRVMMNFGFADLRLVNPLTDHLGEEARHMAVKAASLLESARVYSDLPAALDDRTLVLGSTRRFGKYREDFLHPDAVSSHLAAHCANGGAALVFGREDSGLRTAELDCCQMFITIPTHMQLPSMNLAQAVGLCLYELAKVPASANNGDISQPAPRQLASRKDVEAMLAHMRATLCDIGYLNPQNPQHVFRSFLRIFGRNGLDDREVRVLHGLWSRIDWIEAQRRQKVSDDL